MMTRPTDAEHLRDAALKRLKDKQEFWTHLVVYLSFQVMLVTIWAVTSDGGLFWPIFPMMGWGIGLLAHAWETFARPFPSEAEVEREMQRLAHP